MDPKLRNLSRQLSEIGRLICGELLLYLGMNGLNGVSLSLRGGESPSVDRDEIFANAKRLKAMRERCAYLRVQVSKLAQKIFIVIYCVESNLRIGELNPISNLILLVHL